MKLCASFQIHRCIQTGVTVLKRSVQVKIGDVLSHVTLKFDGRPWKTIGTSSILRRASCIISNPLVNLKWSYSPKMLNSGHNWWFLFHMTLKNKRALLLCYFKLCASFRSHWWIQTVRSYSPETAKLGFDLCDLDLWPLTLTFCMDITFVNGNNYWKFHDDTMTGTLWKRWTDGQKCS